MSSVIGRAVAIWCWVIACAAGCTLEGAAADGAGETLGAVEQALAPFESGGWADGADQDCQVVLRTARRPIGDYGYETQCSGPTCWLLWEAQIDVDQGVLDAGGVPKLLFHATTDSSWWQVDGQLLTEGAPSGYQRFSFVLSEHTMPSNQYWGTLLDSALEVIAAVELPGKVRLFGHNRVTDPLQNVSLDRSNSWTLQDDSTICWGPEGRPVRLASAQVSSLRLGGGQIPEFQTVLNGFVETKLTSDPGARVVIHHLTRRGSQVVRGWATTDATDRGDGLWEFRIPSYPATCPHYCDRIVYQFAVALMADGQTHWDNNGGANVDYRLANDFGGAVPVFWAPPALLDSPVRLEYARWRDGTVQGRVLVRNLGYNKQVMVRYSTDGWQSENDSYAQFDGLSISPELEYWRFFFPLPQPGNELHMAVRYQVGGQEHWDNHRGQDYLLPTPNGLERAIPEP
ncbi:MAG: hypothetical protein DRI90_07945 [Deltaproteobacteria bacterium]|nr:MAG: hypothetical protein DRI90_07945 [Deltaproteobacteria bacterium]